jgi:hypothetical protein
MWSSLPTSTSSSNLQLVPPDPCVDGLLCLPVPSPVTQLHRQAVVLGFLASELARVPSLLHDEHVAEAWTAAAVSVTVSMKQEVRSEGSCSCFS